MSERSAEEGWSGQKTAEVVGITYRQLDYWARTNLVRPSLVDAKGSGSRRRYSYRDLLELKVIKRLLDAASSSSSCATSSRTCARTSVRTSPRRTS